MDRKIETVTIGDAPLRLMDRKIETVTIGDAPAKRDWTR